MTQPVFRVKPLKRTTWPDFARLVEKHNGVWGGCWCMSFHLQSGFSGRSALQNRDDKERRVLEGKTHAALVYDGPSMVGWCQFGPAAELPRIRNKRTYLDGLERLRIGESLLFSVDRDPRGNGVASAALEGALQLIAKLGGGSVESCPEDVEGRRVSTSFLHNGTLSMFERHGFKRLRRLGKNHWWQKRAR